MHKMECKEGSAAAFQRPLQSTCRHQQQKSTSELMLVPIMGPAGTGRAISCCGQELLQFIPVVKHLLHKIKAARSVLAGTRPTRDTLQQGDKSQVQGIPVLHTMQGGNEAKRLLEAAQEAPQLRAGRQRTFGKAAQLA